MGIMRKAIEARRPNAAPPESRQAQPRPQPSGAGRFRKISPGRLKALKARTEKGEGE